MEQINLHLPTWQRETKKMWEEKVEGPMVLKVMKAERQSNGKTDEQPAKREREQWGKQMVKHN